MGRGCLRGTARQRTSANGSAEAMKMVWMMRCEAAEAVLRPAADRIARPPYVTVQHEEWLLAG